MISQIHICYTIYPACYCLLLLKRRALALFMQLFISLDQILSSFLFRNCRYAFPDSRFLTLNLFDLAGSVYSAVDVADGSQDPYTLVEARHLPSVKAYDVAVRSLE